MYEVIAKYPGAIDGYAVTRSNLYAEHEDRPDKTLSLITAARHAGYFDPNTVSYTDKHRCNKYFGSITPVCCSKDSLRCRFAWLDLTMSGVRKPFVL